MHEMAIAVELVEQLEALAVEHGIECVESVDVTAGVLRQIVPDALQMAFAAAAVGTCAGDAALNLKIVPAMAQCRICKHEFSPEPDAYLCAVCNHADVEIIRGDEIVLTSVTGKQSDGESRDEN